MTDAEFLPLLELAIARSGHERYRYLCFEHPSAETRAAYWQQVIEIATREWPPAADVSRLDAAYASEGVEPRKGGCCGG